MEDEQFDIESVIDLIKEQEPERLDIIEQLRTADKNKWNRQAYIYLVSGKQPNEPGSEWQFAESIVLEHETEGTIVLDILKDGRIGGIELVNQISY